MFTLLDFEEIHRMLLHIFDQILWFFHLSNPYTEIPPGEQGYDKLGKVRALIDALKESFQAEYSLPRDIAVGEAMISFKGLISFHQVCPRKSHICVNVCRLACLHVYSISSLNCRNTESKYLCCLCQTMVIFTTSMFMLVSGFHFIQILWSFNIYAAGKNTNIEDLTVVDDDDVAGLAPDYADHDGNDSNEDDDGE